MEKGIIEMLELVSIHDLQEQYDSTGISIICNDGHISGIEAPIEIFECEVTICQND